MHLGIRTHPVWMDPVRDRQYGVRFLSLYVVDGEELIWVSYWVMYMFWIRVY